MNPPTHMTYILNFIADIFLADDADP
jgi:hypothetical protein